jgi:hypothetical protein
VRRIEWTSWTSSWERTEEEEKDRKAGRLYGFQGGEVTSSHTVYSQCVRCSKGCRSSLLGQPLLGPLHFHALRHELAGVFMCILTIALSTILDIVRETSSCCNIQHFQMNSETRSNGFKLLERPVDRCAPRYPPQISSRIHAHRQPFWCPFPRKSNPAFGTSPISNINITHLVPILIQ